MSLAVHRSANAATPVVTANDYLSDTERVDGEFHHRQKIKIGGMNEVSDIAVHEDFTGLKPSNDVCWDPTIGAANPKILRTLDSGEIEKVLRVGFSLFSRPSAVVGEERCNHQNL
jgi:hypothetical protein